MDIVAWLRQSGFGEYAGSFAENKIDAAVLRQLSDGDLRELGVVALGDRKKLLAAIAVLRQEDTIPLDVEAGQSAPSASGSPLNYTPHHLAARILDTRSGLEGERKHVTVLFADIKGSTALIENLDPEEAALKLGPAIAHMMAAVHRYEGTVNKVQGDGIMALFGAPLAHEDHAVRACLSALEIRDALANASDSTVELRVGLHSGEVLVRAIHNDLSMDYDAIGATVHLASRMEQMAPTGGICMTAATHRLAEGFIETRPLGPTSVKGISHDVNVFELLDRAELGTRWEARAAHELTAFVGRRRELDAVMMAAERTRSGKGELIALIGDAGMGKSRLAHELLRVLRAEEWSLLQTGATPYGGSVPFLPVGILLRSMFGIADRDSKEAIESKVLDGLARHGRDGTPLDSTIRFLLNLPIADPAWEELDPRQRQNRIVEDLKSFLLQSAGERPVLLVFEDLHWIDLETQRFIDALADSLGGHRLLLMVTYRPEYQHRWASKSYYTQIRVDPLGGVNATEMLDALLGSASGLDALKRVLSERTEGRPLFIEELVRALKESGVLVEAGGAVRFEGDINRIDIPGSVQDVLASRIDRLDPEAKQLLQTASVIGRRVPVRLLEAIVDAPAAAVESQLSTLRQAEFLYELAEGADVAYQFKHALTEEVAYASLTQKTRRTLHGRLVDAIERLHADRLEEHCEELGRHALRAEQWDRAFIYSRQAAKKAHARSAYASAIEWFDHALAALDRLPDIEARVADKMDVRLEMRTALWPLGRHDELERRIGEAGELAEKAGDTVRLANAYNYLTAHYWQAGEHARAIEFGERGIALAQEADDFSVRVTTMGHLALALAARGEFERQTALHREVAQLLTGDTAYRHHGMAGYPSVIMRGFLAWGLAELGEFDEAFERAREGVAIARDLNSAMSTVWVTDYLALTHLMRGESETALELMQPNFELCRNAEVMLLFSLTAGILGHALTATGHAEAAVEVLRQAVDPHNLTYYPEGSGYPRVWLALAELAAGRPDQGLAQARQAIEVATAQGERGHQAWGWFARGEIEAASDEGTQQSQTSYREALAIAGQCAMRPLAAKCRARLDAVRVE